ncbi:GntR family transcriptional regulator [uncultured Sulfitobacter sp.]|uniref:GntR family transcriptional regulator n=1 Tax=uncultured Sulfitobacter sp. TaxID=191468 RepID=UPI00262022D6|nr:GntR family transcriptional regulator [uncultured Sulfitobacter sp.]
MPLQNIIPNPADEQNAIANSLAMQIIFGKIAPFHRLIEDDLMAEFAASRHRVRRAIDILVSQALVVRETNKGAHVCGYSGEEIQQIYELRDILHTAALRRIKFPVDPKTIAALRTLNDAHVAASSQGDLEKVFHINNRFHATIFACCGNPVLAEAIELQAQRTYPVRTNGFHRAGYLSLAQDEHKKMIDALEYGNVEALILLCRAHIARPMRSYLEQHGLAPCA